MRADQSNSRMSGISFGDEIVEIKNHTAAMMGVITSIRQESSQRFHEMEKYLQSVVKTNVELSRRNEEVVKSNMELISLNKKGFTKMMPDILTGPSI